MSFSSPRLANDPDRYVRPVKGGKFQARPYDDETGVRSNLGLFPTRHAARKAILAFWSDKNATGRLRWARPVTSRRSGELLHWIAVVRMPGYLSRTVTRPRKVWRDGVARERAEAVLVRGGSWRVGQTYPTAREAHDAAAAWVRANVGALLAWWILLGKEPNGRSRERKGVMRRAA